MRNSHVPKKTRRGHASVRSQSSLGVAPPHRVAHVERVNPTVPPSDSDKRKARIMVALGGALALIVSVVIGYSDVAQMKAARHWQPTTCEITRSTVDKYAPRVTMSDRASRTSSDRRPSYGASISYRYTVNGQVYVGNRERFVTETSIDSADVQRRADRYATGTTTGCWYDPAAPSESVLDRAPDYLIALMPLMFFVAGVGLLLFVAFGNWDNVWIRTGGVAQPPGSPPFVAPEGVGDVATLLAARIATRYPGLVPVAPGSSRRIVIVVIVAIVLFVALVVVYGYRTFASLP